MMGVGAIRRGHGALGLALACVLSLTMGVTMGTKYSAIRDQLDTGDLVLFAGTGMVSKLIQRFTDSPWSHVGMVVRSREIDAVLLWESTMLGDAEDVFTGKAVKGVRMVALSERVHAYSGDVAIRRLEDTVVSAGDRDALRVLRQQLNGRPYEQDALELMKSAYDGPGGGNREDLDSIFCSELVAECYQAMGLLPETAASNEFTPADFAADAGLNLQRGRLGAELRLDLSC